MLLVGCAHTISTNEIRSLPTGTEYYTGSILYDPWIYQGTKDDYHYFKYTYPKDSMLRSKRIRIPKSELGLDFEHPYTKDYEDQTAVCPTFNPSAGFSGFKRTMKIEDRVRLESGDLIHLIQ